MFARAVRHVKAGGAIATVAATTLILGSAFKGFDCLRIDSTSFTAMTWRANVIPAPLPTIATSVSAIYLTQ